MKIKKERERESERERERNTFTIFFRTNLKCQIVNGCYWWVKK